MNHMQITIYQGFLVFMKTSRGLALLQDPVSNAVFESFSQALGDES